MTYRFDGIKGWTIEFEGERETFVVPVEPIALERAKCYANEFGGDIQRSLDEDTIPLFLQDGYEILDFATGNMDWYELEDFATSRPKPVTKDDMQNLWVSARKRIVK